MLAHLKIGKRLCGGLPEIGTPLACAAEFGHGAVVRLLQAYAARSDFFVMFICLEFVRNLVQGILCMESGKPIRLPAVDLLNPR